MHHNTARRVTAYLATTAVLIVLLAALRHGTWEGSDALRAIYATMAPAIAFFAGMVALFRYYASRNNTPLLVGTGFLCAALLITYQGLVGLPDFAAGFPHQASHSLPPWCWLTARCATGLSLLLSVIAWRREQQLGPAGRWPAWAVFLVGGVATAAAITFYTWVPLPIVMDPAALLRRPQEIIPALFFALALGAYLWKGQWRVDPFDHWIVLFLIVSLVSQAAYMRASHDLLDPISNLARMLAAASYICVLLGLLSSLYVLFSTAERSASELAGANVTLAAQAAERERARAELRGLADSLEQRVAQRTGELEQSEAKFRTMIDASPLGVFLADAQGRTLYRNGRLAHILGLPAEDMDGQAWVDALHPEDRDRVLAAWADAVQAGQRFESTYRFQHRDGAVVWVSTKGAPVNEGGRLLGFVGTVEDVTDRRSAEENLRQVHAALERKYQEMEEFLSIIAHDLKHPVVGVQALSLIKEDAGDRLDPESRQNLELSLGECEKMKEMLAQLSHLGRIEGVKPKLEPVEMGALVRSCVDRFRAEVQKRQVEVQIEAPPFSGVLARGHIEEALTNLIDNALKYGCGKPGSRIEVGYQVHDGWCQTWVADHGAGIDARFHQRIFQPFRRLGGHDGVAGSGIGLTAVRRLMQRIGGSVQLDSQPGQGARFTLKFPLQFDGPQEPGDAGGR